MNTLAVLCTYSCADVRMVKIYVSDVQYFYLVFNLLYFALNNFQLFNLKKCLHIRILYTRQLADLAIHLSLLE